MIVLCTDYGNSLYSGQVAAKIASISPQTTVIDLIDSLPAFNPQAAAYLLSALVSHLPTACIVLAVVDPGVGGERAPICFRHKSRWFLGPDNGLFSRILCSIETNVDIYRLLYPSDGPVSTTFHGRDVFAPAAASLANHERDLQVSEFRHSATEKPANEWHLDLAELIYFDHFGNAFTGIGAESMEPTDLVRAGNMDFSSARKFSDVEKGASFWYGNSIGLVELAVNQGSAKDTYNLEIGMPVDVH